MEKITSIIGIITITTFIMSFFIKYDVLTSKSNFETQFLTDEQKRKVNIFSMIMISLIISAFTGVIYLVVRILMGRNVDSELLAESLILFFIVFYFSGFIINKAVKIFFNFKKDQTIYSFIDSEDQISYYIHGMMNENICICSKNPKTNIYKDKDIETYMFHLDDLRKVKIKSERIEKPITSLWRKILF